MPEAALNRTLTEFAEGRAGLTLTMSKDGFWLRQRGDQWPITSEQADKVLIAMRAMRKPKCTAFIKDVGQPVSGSRCNKTIDMFVDTGPAATGKPNHEGN